MTWTEIISIIISILTLLGFGTIMQLYWKDKHEKKQMQSKEAQEEAKHKRQEEIREVIKEQIEPLHQKIDAIEEKAKDTNQRLKLTSMGTQAGLRDMLLECYKNCSKKRYKTNEEMMNWQDLLDAYHNLGGNSFINNLDVLMNEIDTEDIYLEKKKAKAKKSASKKKKLLNE